MAGTKDKIVTVESLGALHDYNVKTYLPIVDPQVNGNLFVNGSGFFVGDAYLIREGSTVNLLNSEDIIPTNKGGTGSGRGSIGLKNLFADGVTVLSSYQYGDTLPEAGIAGRIFFKKLVEVETEAAEVEAKTK